MSGLEHASFASQKSLTQVLSDRCVVLDDTEPDDWNEEARKRWELPSQFILVYVCPADSHERPAIHKNLVCYLLDLIAFRSSLDSLISLLSVQT